MDSYCTCVLSTLAGMRVGTRCACLTAQTHPGACDALTTACCCASPVIHQFPAACYLSLESQTPSTRAHACPAVLLLLLLTRVQARAWLAFAQASTSPAEQLSARQAALSALDAVAPEFKVCAMSCATCSMCHQHMPGESCSAFKPSCLPAS